MAADLPSPNVSTMPITYQLNEANHPTIGGVDMVQLAEAYGTPLYVLDEATLRAMAKAYRSSLETHYPAPSLALYAAKANLNLALCRLMDQEGLGLDVVSGGELYTALQAGFPMGKVFFNGNNKTLEELELAIHHGVERITVDNFYELALIHQIAVAKDKQVNILLRVTPGIECHTHDYIKTGQNDSKFGFDLSYLSEALDLLTTDYRETICLKGLHAHIGSQIFEVKPYEDLIEILLNIYFNIRENYEQLTLTDLNIGGGLGIAYRSQDDPPHVPSVVERVTQHLVAYAEKLNFPLPRLLMEPGRSLVATAGVTLYTAGSIKVVPGVRKYVAVDGGMGDNIRPALYQAEYTAVLANKIDQPVAETVTLAGKYCESGDVLIRQLSVPTVEPGDIVMVFGTGAYNYSMSSNYNRIPRPGMVLVENGSAHLLVKRETYDTLLQQDVIPAHLQAKVVEPLSQA